MQAARFSDVAPFLMQWVIPDMRHNRDEAAFIYETLSYTLATFSLLERKRKELARIRTLTTTCNAARNPEFWAAINREIGIVHRIAWGRYNRVIGLHNPDAREHRRPARRRLLRNHLWTRAEEDKFDVFWEQTMSLRGAWRPNFSMAEMQADAENTIPIVLGPASRAAMRQRFAPYGPM